SPPTAIPRRTARCRSPPRTAYGSGALSPGLRAGVRGPPSAVRGSSAHRHEVERLVEVPLPQGEVGGADRGHEPVVEALRDPDALVQVVPAGFDRQLVHAELVCV